MTLNGETHGIDCNHISYCLPETCVSLSGFPHTPAGDGENDLTHNPVSNPGGKIFGPTAFALIPPPAPLFISLVSRGDCLLRCKGLVFFDG